MSEWKVTTPIDTFEQPESGSQIDLVSVVHVGMPSYYRKLGDYIMAKQHDGFTVQYEGIAESDETTEARGPIENTKRRVQTARGDQVVEGYVSILAHSRYTIQDNSELFHGTDSERHDMSEADYISQTSLLTSVRGLIGERRLRRKLEKAATEGSEAMDELVFGLIKEGADEGINFERRNKRHDKVTIHARNQIALEAVDTALVDNPEAKLVLIWGIGHLAGLQSGLLDKGYGHIARQEIDVAANYARLKRDIQERTVDLRQSQAKLSRFRAQTTGIAGGRSQTVAQFQND